MHEDTDQDPFEKFAQDLAKTKEILRKTPASPDNLKAHLHGTILPLMEEFCALVSRSNDGLFNHFDERMEAIEGGSTSIVSEDAEKLLALSNGTIWLIDELSKFADNSALGSAQARISSLRAIAVECIDIVTESRVEDDEDEIVPGPISSQRPRQQ